MRGTLFAERVVLMTSPVGLEITRLLCITKSTGIYFCGSKLFQPTSAI